MLHFRTTYQHAKIHKWYCQFVEDTLSSHPCQFCQNYTNAYVTRNSVDGFLHEARLLQMHICPQQKYVKESENFEIRFCNIYAVKLQCCLGGSFKTFWKISHPIKVDGDKIRMHWGSFPVIWKWRRTISVTCGFLFYHDQHFRGSILAAVRAHLTLPLCNVWPLLVTVDLLNV